MNEEQVRKDSIKSLLNEIQRLKDIIYELEDTIKSKDIIIEALVNQRKMNPEKKKVVRSPQLKEREVKRFKESSSSEDIFKRLPIIGECSVEEQSTPHENDVFSMVLEHTAKSEKTEKPEIVYVKPIIVEQIKAIFSPKTKKQEFKNNFCFFKFIEYCETSYEFNLNNKKISKAKNPLKLYIETNLDKILKYLIDNIKTLNMNQICSTIFLLNSEMDYNHKLVVAHDLILEVDDYSKIPYFMSALFNNLELESDQMSNVLKNILYHQYCIDTNIFQDYNIFEYLEIINSNFNLSTGPVSLWNLAPTLLVYEKMFTEKKDDSIARKVRPEAIRCGFTLRMLCHYLDWDYTYNTLIVSHLFPLLQKDRQPIYAYYLGLLGIHAHKLFGNDQSVINIFDELKSLMKECDETDIVCFLILKQLYEGEYIQWTEKYEKELVNLGFKKEYLDSFLLL